MTNNNHIIIKMYILFACWLSYEIFFSTSYEYSKQLWPVSISYVLIIGDIYETYNKLSLNLSHEQLVGIKFIYLFLNIKLFNKFLSWLLYFFFINIF